MGFFKFYATLRCALRCGPYKETGRQRRTNARNNKMYLSGEYIQTVCSLSIWQGGSCGSSRVTESSSAKFEIPSLRSFSLVFPFMPQLLFCSPSSLLMVAVAHCTPEEAAYTQQRPSFIAAFFFYPDCLSPLQRSKAIIGSILC